MPSARDSARSKPWAGGRQELDRDLHPRKVIAKPRGRVKDPHSVSPWGVRGGPDPGHVRRPDSRGLRGPKPTGEFWGDRPRSSRDEGPGVLTPQPTTCPEQRREAEAAVQLVWATPGSGSKVPCRVFLQREAKMGKLRPEQGGSHCVTSSLRYSWSPCLVPGSLVPPHLPPGCTGSGLHRGPER